MLAFEPNRSWFRSKHVLTDGEDCAMTMRRSTNHKSHSDMVRSQTKNRVNQLTLSFHSFLRLYVETRTLLNHFNTVVNIF